MVFDRKSTVLLSFMNRKERGKMLKIGSHVGMSGTEMLLGSAKEAKKDISELRIKEAHEYMKENAIDDIIIHAPYIINLGNTVKPETYEIAEQFLATELERSSAMGSHMMVLHPGAHVGAGTQAAIAQIVKGLNHVLTRDTDVYVALETMAGKGTEIGRNFEELARIYDGVTYNDKLRVCFDTCHVNDSGYDLVNHLSETLEQFDKIIGTGQIAVFHMNDSKNPCGAGKDRHENIGFGYIGFDTLKEIVYMKEFEHIPKILETPYIKNPDDKKKSYEIEMIRNGVFDSKLKNKILKEGMK